MHSRNTSYVEKVLDHLTGLTAQKDFDLLTLSLLKSLTELLPNAKLQTVSVDPSSTPLQQYRYSDNQLQSVTQDIKLSKSELDALCNAQLTGVKESHEAVGERSLSLFFLNETRLLEHYLLVDLPREFTSADESVIKGVLGIYRNFSTLLLHAQTDELTGLANRRTFEAAVNRIYQSHSETLSNVDGERRQDVQPAKDSFWICSIDIDHFKSVNDNYGHLFGDEVLLRLAQVMQAEFRLDDLLFRFGGEEFIVLLKAPDYDAALLAVERFRHAVEDTEFANVGCVTVSIGVVKVNPSLFHMTLMNYADQALYHSKKNGRNQTTFFEDLLDKGLAKLETFEEGSVELF